MYCGGDFTLLWLLIATLVDYLMYCGGVFALLWRMMSTAFEYQAYCCGLSTIVHWFTMPTVVIYYPTLVVIRHYFGADLGCYPQKGITRNKL